MPSPTTRFTPPLSSYTVVYTRDIFNSVKAPVQTQVPVVAANTSAFKLWGMAVRERERAFAIIEDQGTHVQGLYREGELVAPSFSSSSVLAAANRSCSPAVV